MKTCFICKHQECGPADVKAIAGRSRKPDLDVEYICSDCLLELTQITQKKLNELYKMAIRHENFRAAGGLYTFVSRSIREKYPLKSLSTSSRSKERRNHA